MGEVFRYRVTPGITRDVATIAAVAHRDSSDRIAKLEQTVNKLGDAIERYWFHQVVLMILRIQGGLIMVQMLTIKECFNCPAMGHFKRRCNLTSGQGDPNTTCPLCSQRGHMATQCKLFGGQSEYGQFGSGLFPQGTQGEVPWTDECRQ